MVAGDDELLELLELDEVELVDVVVEVVDVVVGSGSGAGGSGGTGIAPSKTIGTRSAIKRLRPTIDLFPMKVDNAHALADIETSMRVSILGVF